MPIRDSMSPTVPWLPAECCAQQPEQVIGRHTHIDTQSDGWVRSLIENINIGADVCSDRVD